VARETSAAWADAVEGLMSLPMDKAEDGALRPRLLHLTGCGREAWVQFTCDHAQEVNADDFPDYLWGPWKKLRGYCGRLALVAHCLRKAFAEVEGWDVDGESVRRAAVLVRYFKGHALKAYAAMGADPRTGGALRILRTLVAHPDLQAVTRSDVYQHLRRHFQRPEALEGPLRTLTEHRYLRCITPERGGRPGPNPLRYEVNPLWDRRLPCTRDPQDPRDPPAGGADPGEPVDLVDFVYGSEGESKNRSSPFVGKAWGNAWPGDEPKSDGRGDAWEG
jgi:hypothetical protein